MPHDLIEAGNARLKRFWLVLGGILFFAALAAGLSACDLTPVIQELATIAAETPPAESTPGVVAPAGTPVSGLPDIPNKARPVETTFKGCPPDGDGGDRSTNRLKNRVDEATWIPVAFDALEKLPWPKAIERRDRDNWSDADRKAVERYEGLPVSIEGYLAGSREEGPEATNCHGADYEFHDFHVWLVKTAGADRAGSIVVEVTPRIRAKHSAWTTDVLGKVVRAQQRVRISGWTMLDPEHPDQVDNTRGTIWEIHPIMQIEVQQQGRWVGLDDSTR
ncbi:MAG: hypothetical protein E6J26_08845 [Chloroflexi bacterium]|nr:MAG: hypothetical protein E6J26_08845 [Chloroflexota bacterium]